MTYFDRYMIDYHTSIVNIFCLITYCHYTYNYMVTPSASVRNVSVNNKLKEISSLYRLVIEMLLYHRESLHSDEMPSNNDISMLLCLSILRTAGAYEPQL